MKWPGAFLISLCAAVGAFSPPHNPASTLHSQPITTRRLPEIPLQQNADPNLRSTSTVLNSLRSTYDELCQKVGTQFDLQYTDFTAAVEGQTWESPTAAGTAEWLDEASATTNNALPFLTGVSFLTRENDPTVGLVEELSINVWVSASYDVPHMCLTFGEAGDGQYYVTADYVPRGPTPLGSDPSYLERYFGRDVQQSWLEAYPPAGEASNTFPLRPSYEWDSRLLDSPAKISVVGMDANHARAIAVAHVDRFLAWMRTAQPVPPRSRAAFQIRDDQLRQYYFQGQYMLQARLLGENIGAIVANVNTGPLAEAYVGGGGGNN